jgi:chloramphenicol O-acetyltransferase
MIKHRREKIQINKIRDEKGDITTNINEIQRLIKEYFEKLYSSKLENLDEMDEFLYTYVQPKLKQEDISHLNSSITCNEIEAVIKTIHTRAQDLTGSQLNYIKPFKKNLQRYSSNFYKKLKGKEPNSLYEVSIALILKPNEDITRKENYRPISLMNIDAKILN